MNDNTSDPRTAVGIVDRLDSRGSGLNEDEIAFVRAYLAPGTLDAAWRSVPEIVAAREAKTADLRLRDWPNIGQYRDANQALSGQSQRAVFIGDSLTEFWTAADPELFSNGIVGRGISGQTSPQVLLRFMADVVQLKPAIVHLLVGTNDIAGNTGPTTLGDYQNNITAMLSLAQHFGLRMILGSVLPAASIPWRSIADPRPRIAQINAWLRLQAEDRGLIYADYYSAVATSDGALRAEFTRDGVHPTALGYAAMRPIAEAALAQAAG